MTREEFDIGLELLKGEGVTLDLLSGLTKLVDKYIKTLEATIEAQEIIIKDTSAIMEDMANPKTCDGCKYDTQFECTHWSAQQEDCCNRYPNLEDYYEPKAQYE